MISFADNGMMNVISEWLAPLPDKSLPALEIRTDLLKILQVLILLHEILSADRFGELFSIFEKSE